MLAIARPRLNNEQFELMEKAVGMNHEPNCVLADRVLRPYVSPTSTNTIDGMHTFFSSGFAQVDIQLFLDRARRKQI